MSLIHRSLQRTLMPLAIGSLILAGCDRDKPTAKTASSSDAAQLAKATGGPTTQQSTASLLEPVALFTGPMPTGVTVSHTGRIFVCIPHWGDDVKFTVGEWKDGKLSAYPDQATNNGTQKDFAGKFVSVQSVVVGPDDRLWVLDTGSINFGPAPEGGPRLIGYDLSTNKPMKTVTFPTDVCPATSYLNDVRFDLTRGAEGMAFITDSSDKGLNGIIVVDLASGKSWRRLGSHPSTHAEANFVPIVEGEPLMARPPGGPDAYMKMGSDGIAISADGKKIYYTALAGHHLYSVSTDALADPQKSDDDVAKTVEDLGDRHFASDGLESDAAGNVFLTDYENNAIRRRDTNGTYTFVVTDPRLIWPDTMSLATDGYLYVTANQLNRQKNYHAGKDLRKQPYALFRVKIDAQPVMLKK